MIDFIEATKKITRCIDTATTLEHHKAIERIIKNLDMINNKSRPRDKSLGGALMLLHMQNRDKCKKLLINLVDNSISTIFAS